jgi:hypothetical protein
MVRVKVQLGFKGLNAFVLRAGHFQLFRFAKVDRPPYWTQDKWPYDLCNGFSWGQLISVPVCLQMIKCFRQLLQQTHGFIYNLCYTRTNLETSLPSKGTFKLRYMSADKLADMLRTSISDVNKMSGMSADKLMSGRKSGPTCRVWGGLLLCKHTTERVGCICACDMSQSFCVPRAKWTYLSSLCFTRLTG